MPTNQGRRSREKGEDVVWVHSQSPDGDALNVVRKRGDVVSIGQVRKAEEGKPLLGDLISLKQRADAPRLFDVEVVHESAAARVDGPANVSTPAYRKGWAEVFGSKRRRAAGDLN